MPMAFPYALICIASVSPHSRASQVHAPEIPQASGGKWAWRGCGPGVGVCPGRVYLSGRYSGKSGARLRWSSDVSPTEQQKACHYTHTRNKPLGLARAKCRNKYGPTMTRDWQCEDHADVYTQRLWSGKDVRRADILGRAARCARLVCGGRE